MRTGKELILASKEFATENRAKSWFETILSVTLTISVITLTLQPFIPLWGKVLGGLLTSLLNVRLFIIYHDYQHHAILQKSKLASFIMQGIGLYMLAPQNIWKRTHDHHHHHNSKLRITGIGSYPTISKRQFLKLSKNHKLLYLINRHPLTIFFGYFTLFIYWLNLKSFIQSPKKHLDCLAALVVHVVAGGLIAYFLGAATFWFCFFIPFLISFAIGSYLFYSQHNFPGAVFSEDQDWTYDNAALLSTSYMTMSPIMHWFTGNIGYHHIHHLNHRIPFYRLKECMDFIPELQNPPTTSWNPVEVFRCISLKVWDDDNKTMLTMKDVKTLIA